MAKNGNGRVFNCEKLGVDRISLAIFNSGNILEFNWSGSRNENIQLGRDSCCRLIKQVQCFIGHGWLLPEEPPEPTSDAKATAKALLEAVGLEVDPNQIRVIQETKDGNE